MYEKNEGHDDTTKTIDLLVVPKQRSQVIPTF